MYALLLRTALVVPLRLSFAQLASIAEQLDFRHRLPFVRPVGIVLRVRRRLLKMSARLVHIALSERLFRSHVLLVHFALRLACRFRKFVPLAPGVAFHSLPLSVLCAMVDITARLVLVLAAPLRLPALLVSIVRLAHSRSLPALQLLIVQPRPCRHRLDCAQLATFALLAFLSRPIALRAHTALVRLRRRLLAQLAFSVR
jgi:hypothetical protein